MSLVGGFCFDNKNFSQFTEKQQQLNLQALVSVYTKQEHNDIDYGYITFDNIKKNNKCVLVYELEDICLTDTNGEEQDMSIEDKCEFVISKAVEYDNQLEELKSQLLHSFTYSDKVEQQSNKLLLKIVMRILSRQIKVLEDIENYKKVLLEELEKYEDLVDKNILRDVVKTVVGTKKTETDILKTNQGTYIEIANAMKEQLESLTGILSHYHKCNYWNVEINDLTDLTDLLLDGLNKCYKK